MGLPDKYKGAIEGPWEVSREVLGWIGIKSGMHINFAKVATEGVNAFDSVRRIESAEANARLIADAPMLACRAAELEKLVNDLWWFTENVADVAADRHERFFALRVRVRESLAASPLALACDQPPAEREVANA